MGFVALQTNLIFLESLVFFDFVGKLRKSLRLADEFGMAVKALPTGLINNFRIGDLILATNVKP